MANSHVSRKSVRENRKNHPSCSRTKNVSEPHYLGVLTAEGLPDGSRWWVCVAVREINNGRRVGQKYLSISLKPCKRGRFKQAPL